MFGYLTADPALLTAQELDRYRACYCGLCRALRERHGQLSRLTLSYDMTFLVLLLQSLYESEEQQGNETCIAHPRAPRAWWRSEFSDYAADLTVALAWLKCRDDWADEGSAAALAESAVLKPAWNRVKLRWPRQCEAMEAGIRDLGAIERAGREQPDEAASCFARLMGECFVVKEDRWRPALYGMGAALGRFIYILDACMDLDSDVKRENYNPFTSRCGRDNAAYFRQILQMLLADCVRELDRLPLVQDVGLLKNIVCAGLWTEFNKKFGSEEKMLTSIDFYPEGN